MTQVDFYVLPEGSREDRHQFTCRLANKAYGQGRRVYVHLGSEGDARRLDALLWTFREQSFVPHGLLGECDAGVTPVLLGWDGDPAGEDEVLINLRAEIPPFFSRFERVAEILDASAQVRSAGRERYRFYKDRGYPLDTHELSL